MTKPREAAPMRQSTTLSSLAAKLDSVVRRPWLIAVISIAVALQLTDLTFDLADLAASESANPADLVSVGDFLLGCVVALLIRR